MNLRVYLFIWVCFFAYALSALGNAEGLVNTFDRFLPLQFVAGIAAFVVFFSGRSLRPKSTLRRLSHVPVIFTVLGLALTVFSVAGANLQNDIYVDPTRATTQTPSSTPSLGTVLVSL